jgi:hypothetical protein
MFEFILNHWELISSLLTAIVWEIGGRVKETEKPAITPVNIIKKIGSLMLKDRKRGGGYHIK